MWKWRNLGAGEPAALRGPKSSTPCHCDVPKIVPRSSACQCPPFSAQEGAKDGHFQKTRWKSCIQRGPRAFVPIESAGQCLALTLWNHAVSGVPQAMMSPVQRLQMGGVCHFWNMTVPRAGTGNRESTGTAHVKGPVSMAGSWYLLSSTGDSMQYELSCICCPHWNQEDDWLCASTIEYWIKSTLFALAGKKIALLETNIFNFSQSRKIAFLQCFLTGLWRG